MSLDAEPQGQPDMPFDDRASAEELDPVGAKAIELYQNHLSLLDKIWVYFSQYSALIFVMGCALAVWGSTHAVTRLPRLLLGAPVVVYIVLALGNFRTLQLTLVELQMVKNIARTKTRYDFRGTKPTTILLFHRVLMLFVFAIYVGAWWLVGPEPTPVAPPAPATRPADQAPSPLTRPPV